MENFIQEYSSLIIGLLVTAALLIPGILYLLQPKKTSQISPPSEDKSTPQKPQAAPAPSLPRPDEAHSSSSEIPIKEFKSFSTRLRQGLSKSRQEIWGKLEGIFKNQKLSEDLLEQVEELLYSSDLGPEMVAHLIEHLRQNAKDKILNPEQVKSILFNFLQKEMAPIQEKTSSELFQFTPQKNHSLKVLMIVGVNGAGKTTTIGKLATKLTQQGAKVVVGACDTFRAAAVDQLQVWCDRAGAQMVRAKEGADPSGVGHDALATAIQSKADYCLLDTAGRLHTKTNLMEELKKSKRVLSKLMPDAPHQVLLVIDAITGQNALKQAEEFNKALGLSGLIFTKCDGSSRAGNAVSIVKNLQVPLTYIGVGEEVDDLDIFDLNQYLKALLNIEDSLTES